jgi:uncharacterized membrane protein YcaP (DUF421 family)
MQMHQALWNQFQILLGLGLNISDVNAVQMALRTIIVYAVTLAIIRLGSKRFLGKASAFDVIVGIMLGSVMSRAINSSAPFFPTLVSGGVLIGMHWLFAVLAYHFRWFGPFVKGNAVLLIEDGQIQEQGVRQGGITIQDLTEALREGAKQTDLSKIKTAYLERDGEISIIPYKHEPRVLNVSVAEGVQTVRIELEN